MDDIQCDMRQVTGADIGYLDLGEPSKVADLIRYEGPLLSLYRNNEGENLLYYWCDADRNINRWLIFKATDEDLEAFLGKELALRALLTEPKDGFLYLVDLDDAIEQKAAYIVSPKQLPNDYLPSEDSLYDAQPIVEETVGPSTLKVSIDGFWSFYDLHYFPQLFRQAYAFICEFRRDLAVLKHLPELPMRDGFSSMHFFREILDSLPTGVAPSLRGVRYASPGAIMFNVNRGVVATLLQTLDAVRKENSPALVTYNYLHGILGDKKLLGKNTISAKIPSSTSDELSKQAIALAAEMKLPNPETIVEKTPNALMAAKIMLAFYRLVCNRVLGYERDERISIPTLP